jgi:hypothetical protein
MDVWLRTVWAGRCLVSIGERAIRSSWRFAISLPGTAHSVHLRARQKRGSPT